MLSEEILELRKKLNECINNKKKYNEIYKLSVELDQLIVKYYDNVLNDNK